MIDKINDTWNKDAAKPRTRPFKTPLQAHTFLNVFHFFVKSCKMHKP